MSEFVLQSYLPARYYAELEKLVFFNSRQAEAQEGIARAVDAYGTPAIVAGADGLRVVVSRREDAQCLFALKTVSGALHLAGMVMYLRTSPEEIEVLRGARQGGPRRGAPAARRAAPVDGLPAGARVPRVARGAGGGLSSARVSRRWR